MGRIAEICVFAADNRHFSLTLAVPEIETELRTAVRKPETFDRICNAIPGAARWIAPDRAEPVTKVFGMGNLHNVWRHFVKAGEPVVLNYFAVGDSAIRTNPLSTTSDSPKGSSASTVASSHAR